MSLFSSYFFVTLFLFSNIFYILLIFFFKFLNCFFCIFQVFYSFPSIGFSYKPFLPYQILVLFPYSLLFQNSFNLLFLLSLNMTRAGYSFLCPSTCLIYLCILLTLTTKCIFTVLGSFNSTMFGNMIFFIL